MGGDKSNGEYRYGGRKCKFCHSTKKAPASALTDTGATSMRIIQSQFCWKKQASSDPPSAKPPTEHRIRILP